MFNVVGLAVRVKLTRMLKDPEQAGEIADFVAQMLKEHGKDAERMADLALAASVPGTGNLLIAQREARDVKQVQVQGSTARLRR